MKVFEKASDERLYNCHIGNIHYPDPAKKWQDIDTTLLTKAGGFYQDKCFYSCEVPDKANGEFVFFNRDHYFNLKLVGVSSVGYKSSSNTWGNLGKGIEYTNAFGDGIHLEVLVKNMGFDKIIQFDKPPLNPSKDFVIDFEILEMPDVLEFRQRYNSSKTISIDITKSKVKAIPFDQGVISIYSSGGKYKSGISFPTCWGLDTDGNSRRYPIKIVFYTEGGRKYLRKIIPKEIFKNAVYPIFADDPTNYFPDSGEAGDGVIEAGYGAWATVRALGTGAHWHDIAESGIVNDTSDNKKILRGFVPIDTSGIDDAAVITAAIMNIYTDLTNDDFNDAYAYIAITGSTQADPHDLVNDDFDQFTDVEGHDVESI
jgi:hypothetical protein